MDIVKNLYYGNLSPNEAVRAEREYWEKMEQLVEQEEKLREALNKDQCAVLERYSDLHWDVGGCLYADYFSLGFRMGMRFGVQGRTARRDHRARRRLRRIAAMNGKWQREDRKT